MQNDQLQAELDRYFDYGRDNAVRYTHRMRIDRIRGIVESLCVSSGTGSKPKALDAGCSHGVYSIMLGEAGCDVLGIDINEVEIERAKRWAKEKRLDNKIRFRVEDIQRIDAPDNAFDVVVCSEVLEHLDEPDRGAKELFRVLKPGAKAIISMPNMGCLFGLLQWVYRGSGLRSALGKPPLDIFQVQHSRYWFGNIMALLRRNGFAIDARYSTSHLPYIWELDSAFGDSIVSRSIGNVERTMSTLPMLRYLGYNFIAVAQKPAARGPQ